MAALYPLPADLDRARAALKTALAGNNLTNQDWEITRKDGTQRNVLISTSQIEHAGQKWLLGSVRDITLRKRVEQALRTSEARWQSLFENLPVSVWEEDFSAVKAQFDAWRVEGVQDFRTYFETHPEAVAHYAGLVKILEINQTSLKFYEANSKAELLAKLPFYFTPASWAVFKEELIVLAEGGLYFEGEILIRTPKNSEKILYLTLSVVPGCEDTLERVLVSSIDITERKHIEEALQRTNLQLQRRVDELFTLNLIAQTVAAATDLPTILQSLAETITRCFDGQGTSISLYNPTRLQITITAHYTTHPSPKSLVGLTVPVAQSPLAAHFLQPSRVYLISMAEESAMVTPLLEELQARNIQAIMAVPLMIRGEVIGIIGITTQQPHRTFTEAEARLAETIAGQVAGVIETARLFEQERRQRQIAESLREVATILNSSLNQPAVLAKIIEQLGRVIPSDGIGIFLRVGDALQLTAGAGPSAEPHLGEKILLTHQNPGIRTFNNRQLLIINDLSVEPYWLIWPDGAMVKSWMGAPLI